jgi:hypothetical protein
MLGTLQWSDRQLADFRESLPKEFQVLRMMWTTDVDRVVAGPKSDAEALEIGVKKFDAMVRNHNF